MADKDSRAGAHYADEAILDFVHSVHAKHDDGLAAAFAAADSDGLPAIQVGPSEGRLIELLLKLIGARRAVELGTLAGYSAIRMARAMGEDGHLWTVELEPGHAAVARRNLAGAGLTPRVDVVIGSGTDVLPQLEKHGPFDAVFIDADKVNYDRYGQWAARHLRSGGLLIGDNAFLFGNLMDDTPAAVAMRRFHEEAAESFDTVCIPTGDGLLVGIKR